MKHKLLPEAESQTIYFNFFVVTRRHAMSHENTFILILAILVSSETSPAPKLNLRMCSILVLSSSNKTETGNQKTKKKGMLYDPA